jgi:hypothetical protein
MSRLLGRDGRRRTAIMGIGLAAVDEIFRPTRHRQIDIVAEARRRRVDINSGAGGIDFERGTAVLRVPLAEPPLGCGAKSGRASRAAALKHALSAASADSE